MTGRLNVTHTYALLEVSRATYDEIAGKLREADYGHAFHDDDGKTVIDMHGIALQAALSCTMNRCKRHGDGPDCAECGEKLA